MRKTNKCIYCHKELTWGAVCNECEAEMPKDPNDNEEIVTGGQDK